jgi:hypothetical protein
MSPKVVPLARAMPSGGRAFTFLAPRCHSARTQGAGVSFGPHGSCGRIGSPTMSRRR